MLLFRYDTCVARKEFEISLNFLTFFCAFTIVMGYNLNTESAKLFHDPKSVENSRRASYFGFSTALYASTDTEASVILVGAPRANVSTISSVFEPGTVYKCGINDEECVEWNLDPTGNGFFFGNRDSKIIQIKDNAWIGATIAVESNGETQSRVVVCAPRWKSNIMNSNVPNWFMNGMCYWSMITRNGETFEKQAEKRLIPLLGNSRQITSSESARVYNYGMGETGVSLHLCSSNNQSEILLGNPGVHNWKGVPLLLKAASNRPIIPSIGHERLIMSADYLGNAGAVGYSVSSGCYFERGERWYAAGAPRSADLMGRVLIFRFSVLADRRLNVKKVLDGEQHGEYFGASLASCDINNDGRDEIVVGAPLWSKYMDEGRVYVYRVNNNANGEFVPRYLDGSRVIGARFGSVVTCLGDLDYDGYGDIAVGAPYEDDNHGAIYIYNGDPSISFNRGYSQRIAGKSIFDSIRGFGCAISEPRDIDGNAYADIAVGAYLSGHVALLRSRPVVTIKVSVTYLGVKELQDDTTFFTVNVCSSYDGSHVPQKLDVERILKVDPLEGRAFYGLDKNINGEYKLPVTLHRGTNTCDELMINLVKGIENVIEPIEIGVSLALVNPKESQGNNPRTPRKFCADCPIVNKALSKIYDSTRLHFAVDCGPDNVCTSILDLAISANNLENVNRYTLGSTNPSTLRLAVRVDNRGEPAYNTQAHVFIPSPISLVSIPPECTEYNPRTDGLFQVTCQLGNPLLRDEEATSILELDMSGIRSSDSLGHVVFFANVSTRSVNVNAARNTHNFTIYLDVDVDIAIAGKSQQDLYSYSNKDQVQLSESIRFQHIYEVQKFGVSPIEESVVTVSVPTHWTNINEESVEIVSVNETFGFMEGRTLYCTKDVNYENIFNATTISTDAPILKTDRTFERSTVAEDSKSNVPPDNRTLYLNCTNLSIKCTRISCKLGTFANSLAVAKLTITLDLQLQNLRPEAMKTRDIIYFVSNGSVSMTQPRGNVERVENKPDSTLVATTFVGSPIASRVAIWIIVLSLVLGILLLVLLILGLIKLGFFHRKKREQLEALKAESENNHCFVLETSSSREALDKD